MRKIQLDHNKLYTRLRITAEVAPRIGKTGRSYRRVSCICTCGETVLVDLEPLIRGLTHSCGCLVGDVIRARAAKNAEDEDAAFRRLWSRIKTGEVPVHRPELGPCWMWTGALSADGYGRWWKDGRNRPTHIFVYEDLVGPVPAGLQLDHLCRVRACCNPKHLEPVTCRENLLRGDTFAACNAVKTHCPRGHTYTPENTRTYGRSRQCVACQKERAALVAAARPPRDPATRKRPTVGIAAAARARAKTHCKNGHEFTPENTLFRGLGLDGIPTRRCRICKNASTRNSYANAV